MDGEEVRPWPVLPRECLESIALRGGPQAAALLSSTCKSWRTDLSDDIIWRSWHCLPLLRYHTYQSSYLTYAQSLRNWLAGWETATALVPAAHERWLTSLDLSPSHVLSGSLDANVKYWDRGRTGTWLHYLRGHKGPVSSVRLAYDNLETCTAGSRRACSGSRDGTVRCWDLSTGTCVRAYTLEGGRQWVNTLAVWRPHMPPMPPTLVLTAVAASWEQKGSDAAASPMTVVCGTSIGQVCVYDVRQSGPAQKLFTLQCVPAPGAVYGVAVYGDALAAACANGHIYVWDLRTGHPRHILDEHGSACTCVAMYGHNLVAGDLEGNVYLWSTQETRMRFRGAISTAGRISPTSLSKPQTTTAMSTATATTAGAVATPDLGAVALAECATDSFSSSTRLPPGPRWPYWRPHRRRPGVKTRSSTCASSRSGGSSSSSSSSDAEGGHRGRSHTGVDGAVATSILQALSEGRLLMSPNGSRQPLGSSGLRSGSTRCATMAIGGGATLGADIPQPGLRAVMRHTEWVRDVALVGPMLVLSSSKDGLVCLSRMDTMQVVAVWDVAAPCAVATATSAEGPSGIHISRISASEAASHDTGCGATTASGHVVNQVHALAADEWGFVAGCQDASMRVWTFLPGGVLPELSTQFCGVKRSEGS
ncbi:hypothetical protein VaNZ11_016064 [Volvox africanus]|uniref:F-box domain-containing protein n=1 Tax=Volvox africanus TaxID=51714 RepID=A0ABQ5SLV2_9CHLO|nr:hypothetical protein VaNZ11_016064 [Volvox africanus]